jgi:hypothetical protein
MIASAGKIIESDIPTLKKLEALIKNDIDHLLKHPELPLFMMREMARDPSLMNQFEHKKNSDELLQKMFSELEQAKKKGLLKKDTDIRDLFINITSLTMFPFLSGPFCSSVFHFTKKEYTAWLTKRKETIPKFILSAIQK